MAFKFDLRKDIARTLRQLNVPYSESALEAVPYERLDGFYNSLLNCEGLQQTLDMANQIANNLNSFS